MQDLITAIESLNKPGLLDYINLSISILGSLVAVVAIGLTVYTIMRQDKIAIYDKRKVVYHNVLKMKEFLCLISLFDKALKGSDLKRISKVLEMIDSEAIDYVFYYEFKESGFVIPKKNKRIIEEIANELEKILFYYKMAKESIAKGCIYDKEEIEALYSHIPSVQSNLKELEKLLEKLLQY